MRIALISPSFLPATGGAELVVHNLAQAWGRQGHQVHVLNWLGGEATHDEATYSVARFRLLRGAPRVGYHRFPWGFYSRSDIARQLRSFKPDFISAHMAYPTGYYLDGLMPSCPHVITCHGSDLTGFAWGYRQQYDIDDILRSALNGCAGAIAISSVARRLMEELGVAPDHVHDIPNGVDLDRFRKRVEFDLRCHFQLDEGRQIILSVGREHEQKAYATGLRAFAQVAAQDARAHYLLLGRGTGVHADLCEELGIRDRVTLCEGLFGDQLVAAYQQADIFFSPSIWEMMPLVVLEAMGWGRGAVVTNMRGSQDLVFNEENGLVVEPNDIQGLAHALLRLLADKELQRSFSDSMLEYSERYSWESVSRSYLALSQGNP